MYVWPCIIYENDERYQLDVTIVIYYHKYLYMFRASICPSSGVQIVYYCIWCSAIGFVAVALRSRCVVLCTVCKSDTNSHTVRKTTRWSVARLHTGSLGSQPQHLVLNTICSNIQSVLLKMGIYRVSQEEYATLLQGFPYVKVYRYNPKHLCPKLNGYGDNGQREVWSSGRSTHCTCQLTTLSMSVLECGFILRQFSSCSQ